MRYTAYHGSTGPAFEHFDPARAGSASGYDHAMGAASFSSSESVALHYAEGDGFVGRFAFELDNPLEIQDSERPTGIAAFLRMARSEGHDGVILRGCEHTAISPAEPSDIFIVFDLAEPRCIQVVQEGPEPPDRPRPARRR
jgi:hypothetical protein